MLEFIFFHPHISRQFVDFVNAQGIDCVVDEDGESITVSVDEDIGDNVADRIEEEYDRLLDMSRDEVDSEQRDRPDDYTKASLLITLKNGKRSYAHVDTDAMNRMLSMISNEELNDFIAAVVDAVENPDERSYCQRQREEGW